MSNVVDHDDVGVLELGRRPSLALKALYELLVKAQLWSEYLDGNVAVEGTLVGTIDHRHPTAADLFDNVVIAESVTK
jgi:hypothetical protein